MTLGLRPKRAMLGQIAPKRPFTETFLGTLGSQILELERN